MPSFIFSPAARQDLLEIWQYISEESPENAIKVLDSIEQKCSIERQSTLPV
ncbi:MAG: type II toxin-antitoxin system RelE/ParE family toxin [Holosporales bacterium]|nr:type II toxin-antitoxin system RelE/ParE family toxin [Holosporales bacterium]